MSKVADWFQKVKSVGGAVSKRMGASKWNYLALGLATVTALSVAYWGDNAVSKTLSNLGEMVPHATPKLFLISAGLCVAAIAARGIPALYRRIKYGKQHNSMREDLSHTPCNTNAMEEVAATDVAELSTQQNQELVQQTSEATPQNQGLSVAQVANIKNERSK